MVLNNPLSFETADASRRTVHEHLDALARDLNETLDRIGYLQTRPSDNAADFYLEAVRVAEEARRLATQRRDHIAFTAHGAGAKISIARLARAMGISVNTLRSRLPALQRPHSPEPFDAF